MLLGHGLVGGGVVQDNLVSSNKLINNVNWPLEGVYKADISSSSIRASRGFVSCCGYLL